MQTESKKPLNEIAAKAPRKMKRLVAHLALCEAIRGKRIDCIETLRTAAVITLLNSNDPSEKKACSAIIDEIGLRGNWRSFDTAEALSEAAKDVVAELALIGHIVVGGSKRIFESTAILLALKGDGAAKEEAFSLLKDSRSEQLNSTFKQLITIGALSLDDMDRFLNLQLKLAALRKDMDLADGASNDNCAISKRAEPERAETPSGIVHRPAACEDSAAECLSEPSASHSLPEPQYEAFEQEAALSSEAPCLEQAQPLFHIEDDDSMLAFIQSFVDEQNIQSPAELEMADAELFTSARERHLLCCLHFCREERTSSLPERFPVEDDLAAEELRNVDLSVSSLTDAQFYRLICVECFRLATAKPLVGNFYAPMSSIQSNLMRKVKSIKELRLQFRKCWGRMVSSDAILVKKSGSKVASLNPHICDIGDEEIREQVEWAFAEHRRIHNGS